MCNPVAFSAQCPSCRNEVSQGPRESEDIKRLLANNCLYFYCPLCDREWPPSEQELVNVEHLLANPCV
jgi:hypothetical protein